MTGPAGSVIKIRGRTVNRAGNINAQRFPRVGGDRPMEARADAILEVVPPRGRYCNLWNSKAKSGLSGQNIGKNV